LSIKEITKKTIQDIIEDKKLSYSLEMKRDLLLSDKFKFTKDFATEILFEIFLYEKYRKINIKEYEKEGIFDIKQFLKIYLRVMSEEEIKEFFNETLSLKDFIGKESLLNKFSFYLQEENVSSLLKTFKEKFMKPIKEQIVKKEDFLDTKNNILTQFNLTMRKDDYFQVFFRESFSNAPLITTAFSPIPLIKKENIFNREKILKGNHLKMITKTGSGKNDKEMIASFIRKEKEKKIGYTLEDYENNKDIKLSIDYSRLRLKQVTYFVDNESRFITETFISTAAEQNIINIYLKIVTEYISLIKNLFSGHEDFKIILRKQTKLKYLLSLENKEEDKILELEKDINNYKEKIFFLLDRVMEIDKENFDELKDVLIKKDSKASFKKEIERFFSIITEVEITKQIIYSMNKINELSTRAIVDNINLEKIVKKIKSKIDFFNYRSFFVEKTLSNILITKNQVTNNDMNMIQNLEILKSVIPSFTRQNITEKIKNIEKIEKVMNNKEVINLFLIYLREEKKTLLNEIYEFFKKLSNEKSDGKIKEEVSVLNEVLLKEFKFFYEELLFMDKKEKYHSFNKEDINLILNFLYKIKPKNKDYLIITNILKNNISKLTLNINLYLKRGVS